MDGWKTGRETLSSSFKNKNSLYSIFAAMLQSLEALTVSKGFLSGMRQRLLFPSVCEHQAAPAAAHACA